MSESSNDDDVLISRSIKGDRGAFDTLVTRHLERAYQYAFRLTKSQDLASDIVAEGFVRVFNALPNFKGNSSFSTWLYRILTNCFLDQRKREKSKPTTSLDSSIQNDVGEVTRQFESLDPSPTEIAEQGDRLEALRHAMILLPEYQRAMLVMYHVESLSYEEIAQALDLPIGTVKSRLNRARQQMKDILGKNEELFNFA